MFGSNERLIEAIFRWGIKTEWEKMSRLNKMQYLEASRGLIINEFMAQS